MEPTLRHGQRARADLEDTHLFLVLVLGLREIPYHIVEAHEDLADAAFEEGLGRDDLVVGTSNEDDVDPLRGSGTGQVTEVSKELAHVVEQPTPGLHLERGVRVVGGAGGSDGPLEQGLQLVQRVDDHTLEGVVTRIEDGSHRLDGGPVLHVHDHGGVSGQLRQGGAGDPDDVLTGGIVEPTLGVEHKAGAGGCSCEPALTRPPPSVDEEGDASVVTGGWRCHS